MRVGTVMDGIAALYVAVTLEEPPLPDCLSSVTVYVFAVHFAYSVVAEVLSQLRALVPSAL